MEITNKKNGKKALGLVRDSCPGCGDGDIGAFYARIVTPGLANLTYGRFADMSPSLFEELGDLDTGVLTVSWDFTSN